MSAANQTAVLILVGTLVVIVGLYLFLTKSVTGRTLTLQAQGVPPATAAAVVAAQDAVNNATSETTP